jgi:hypothetical protein
VAEELKEGAQIEKKQVFSQRKLLFKPKKHSDCRLFEKILPSPPDFGLKKTEYDVECLILAVQSVKIGV